MFVLAVTASYNLNLTNSTNGTVINYANLCNYTSQRTYHRLVNYTNELSRNISIIINLYGNNPLEDVSAPMEIVRLRPDQSIALESAKWLVTNQFEYNSYTNPSTKHSYTIVEQLYRLYHTNIY